METLSTGGGRLVDDLGVNLYGFPSSSLMRNPQLTPTLVVARTGERDLLEAQCEDIEVWMRTNASDQ